jgi:hypothetical protein
MYTFRGCESPDFCNCHSTFLSVNCRVTHTHMHINHIFFCGKKEVENNAIARLNAYAKQYVTRRTGAAGGSSGGGGSSGRS